MSQVHSQGLLVEAHPMKTQVVFAVVIFMLCIFAAVAQESAPAKPYNVDEAYQIYSLLIPQEESSGFSKGTVIIQEETVSSKRASDACLTPEAADRFKEAIADFDRVNNKRWLLQRQFQFQMPYELVSSDTISLSFKDHGEGWDGFYKRYPGSAGYVILSAVGFDKAKSQAIVYTGSSCGNLCGAWSFHLLEKIGGKWQRAPGITCHTVS